MTRDWYWIRHGPTHAKSMIGWSDLAADLSDVQAIRRLASVLPNAPVVSSDLIRAVQTADAIQGSRTRLAHQPSLREIHFGRWEGLDHIQARKRDPELIFAFWDKPGSVAAPDGESWDQLADRVNRAVDRLDAEMPPGPIIAVAHFGTILTQVQRVLGISAHTAFGHKIENLSLTHLRLGPAPKAISINQVL